MEKQPSTNAIKRAWAVLWKYSEPGREIYIGNMHASKQLQLKHPNLVTINCYDGDGKDPQEDVHTFYDTEASCLQGSETAKAMILAGAEKLEKYHQRGPVLVNCHRGVNRSGSIIAAWAILYFGDQPSIAVETIRKENKQQRRMPAINNKTFQHIIDGLEPPPENYNISLLCPKHLVAIHPLLDILRNNCITFVDSMKYNHAKIKLA